jgi:hypothetical protein
VRAKGKYVKRVGVMRDKEEKPEDVDVFHTLGRGEENRKTE